MNNIRSNLMIYYAIILQLITVVFIMLSPEPIKIARLGVFYSLFTHSFIGAFLMLTAISLSITGLVMKAKGKTRTLLFLPQFAFLIFTSGSALSFTIQGHYADGVIRSWDFIFLDQLPSFIASFLYMFAVLDFTKKDINGTGGQNYDKK